MSFQKPLPGEIQFPDELPISQKRDQIAETIRDNQVVILAGETGSGKTTQLPKICLSLGRGQHKLIGHTQPRRIAARTVANRIAEELKVELGKGVGYQVRFNDQSDPSTWIKVMTDGILLAEIRHDPLLKRYDTLIIDEAHERSLNIDFLLGYIKKILPRRPDLKVIVTSATIDLEKFSRHFNDAPIIEVSGRMFPVDVDYRPWQDEFEDITEAVTEVVAELSQKTGQARGDILVFLSGERDIRECSHQIKKRALPGLEVLPLYARLSLAEQNRVFQAHRGVRVVLATNVAETSLTVPGIRYVIDPGTARIKRYSLRTKVQRLPIEAISQASANQRKGRCGRVQAGRCIRLYSEDDFLARPEFTEAEILRSNLAGVVLQMLDLNIGDIRKFPFVEVPESRAIKDGYRLLEELGAVNTRGKMTEIGKRISQFQIDPLLARMLVEAQKQSCLHEMLIIVSALSIQDIRERPTEKKQHADEMHRRFWHEHSDFMSILSLWAYLEEQRQDLSQNQLRKRCQKEFLNYLRYREWRELHHQLRIAIKQQGWRENQQAASYASLHSALLSGLLSNIGQKNEERGERNYKGTRNRLFHIFPGSSQYKKRPAWLFAGEMLETSQLYAHNVAKVEVDWIISQAGELKKVQHYEPFYHAKSGQVMAFQRTLLFGLLLREKERVTYGNKDPSLSREIFIRSALVEGLYEKHSRGKGTFFKFNQQLIEEVLALEARSRRRDIMVDDEQLFAFYDQRLPHDIMNIAGFERWRKHVEKDKPTFLHMDKTALMLHSASDVSVAQFPREIDIDGICYPLHYHFEPGHQQDGVNIEVPVSLLHQISAPRLEWLVPGMLEEKCVALIKNLPKPWRKKLVPVPQTAAAVLARLEPGKGSLLRALSEQLKSRIGEEILDYEWPLKDLDPWYHFNIRVIDEKGQLIDQGRDLASLREKYRHAIRATLSKKVDSFQNRSLQSWDMDKLEEKIELDRGDVKVLAYPMLKDKHNEVELCVHDNPVEAHWHSARAKNRLALLGLKPTVKYLQKELLKGKEILLSPMNLGTPKDVLDDLLLAVLNHCAEFAGISTKEDFERELERIRPIFVEEAERMQGLFIEIAESCLRIRKTMKASKNALSLAFAFADINQQLDNLVYKGFLFNTPKAWLMHFPRYLKAIQLRLEKAPQNSQKDRLLIEELKPHWVCHEERLLKLGEAAYWHSQDWQTYRWLIEELRVSLFAQQLKTVQAVSSKRLKAVWQALQESD